jgi:hypothetical protein
VQVYNDDGSNGGFCELEVQGRAVIGCSGRVKSTEMFDFWQYEGPGELIGRVMLMLLGFEERQYE